MKKRYLVSLFMLTVTLIILTGCGSFPSEEERKVFKDATIVFDYFPRSPDGSVTFFAGAYQGGTAIVALNDVAFWVKDGKAYTVSDAAREVAPELEQAPDHVKYDYAFIVAAYGDGEGDYAFIVAAYGDGEGEGEGEGDTDVRVE